MYEINDKSNVTVGIIDSHNSSINYISVLNYET